MKFWESLMTKATVADTTLTELWAVKDETAARFKSVGEYLAHVKAEATPSSRSVRARQTARTPNRKSEAARSKVLRAA